MERSEKASFIEGLQKAGKESLRPDEWIVYPEYKIRPHEDGRKDIFAQETVESLRGREFYRPLAHTWADLFVKFANWPKTHGMSKSSPDAPENERAALAWAENYGVLGTNPPRVLLWGTSSLALEDYLGRLGPNRFEGKRMLNDGLGGGPEETVQRFTDEALEAHFVWRLYEAVSAKSGTETEAIVRFMSDERDDLVPHYPSTRELHGQSQSTAQKWALEIIEETVTKKVANRCYPVLLGSYSESYEQGWAFDSLLGAMWLQMMWFLTGKTRRCEWCYEVLVPEESSTGRGNRKRRTRSDKSFCSSKCRANWNYNYGTGKSGKFARKKTRERQQSK